MKDSAKRRRPAEPDNENYDEDRVAVKRSVSPLPQRSKRRIIEDSVEQVLRDTIFQLSVNKLQFPRWKLHEPPLSRTVLIWNMVRVIDKEIQEERVVDDVLSILGDENNVKFIKVCRTDNLPAPDPKTKSESKEEEIMDAEAPACDAQQTICEAEPMCDAQPLHILTEVGGGCGEQWSVNSPALVV